MAKTLNRREIVVVNPRLQYKYLVLPLLIALTTAVSLLVLFIIQAGVFRGFAEGDPDLAAAVSRVQLYSTIIAAAVLIAHVVLVLLLGLVVSHKVAGPIFRIKKSLEDVAGGNLNVRIHLRPGDQLTDVADAFNHMMNALSERFGAQGAEEPG